MLSSNSQFRYLGQIKPGIAGNAGVRQFRNCYKKVKTLAWHYVVEGDLVISVATATAVVDTGSILAAFPECGINDGQDRLLSNPQDMRFMTEAWSAKARQAKRLTTLTVGTTHLKEEFSIFASPPFAANREEVCFMEHDPSGDFIAFIKQSANADGGASLIVTPGGATVSLTNVVVSVYQEIVTTNSRLPIFQPRWEVDTIPVTGADAAQVKNFLKNYYFQGILLRQDVSLVSRVGDIQTSFKLGKTGGMIVGDEQAFTDHYQMTIDGELDGNVYTQGGVNPYVLLWFQRGGRLSKVLKPNDPNLILTQNVAPSVTAGASRIMVTYFMLDRDQTVRPDGTRVTLPNDQLPSTGLTI